MPEEKTVSVGIKLHINGFAKSGTHVLANMGAVVLRKKSAVHNWLGNLLDYAFTTRIEEPQTRVLDRLADFPPNSFTKGHMAYTPEVAEALVENKICSALIFRDFRDVAVSATFHALDDNMGNKYPFPKKEFYMGLSAVGEKKSYREVKHYKRRKRWL